ncbi:hypothetical protein RhiirB3_458211, partial [Rhizophagus irregularis]
LISLRQTSTSRKTPKKQPATLASKTISTAWDQVIAIKFKSQQKYTTITVTVNLNKAALDLWNSGVWTTPLEGLLAVSIGISVSTTIATLYLENFAYSILTPVGCKAFKLIQDKQRRNRHQKVKQDDDSKVSQNNTNTSKSDKKQNETK